MSLLTDLDGTPERTVTCVVEPPDGRAVAAAARIHGPTAASGEVIVCALFPENNDFVDPDPASVPLRDLAFIHDQHGATIAADGRLRRVGVDPDERLGANGFLQVHPCDLPAVMPMVRGILAGEVEEATLRMRVIGPLHMWVPVVSTYRPLAGLGGAYLALHSFEPDARHNLPVDSLTEAENDIVRLLFIGKRIETIAATRGVSERTIRNQLSTVYRKLGIGSQTELLDGYLPPLRLTSEGTYPDFSR